MADFYTMLTNAGIAYETAAKAAGTPIKLAKMSVGDGGGAVYNPDATATALRREVWRGDINALIQDKSNPNWLVAELVIPDAVGGWTVREAGIWTDTGILYAIIKYPESFKPILSAGAGKEFYVRSIFQTSNAASVTLLVDESIVKATRAWVIDYVAAELAKLDWKKSVRAIATAPITLSGAQTVDGVVLVAGDRVLVVGQAAAKDNGIYIVANGPWVRADDANLSIEVSPNLFVMVEEGTAYSDSAWQLVTNGAIVLGTTPLTFEMAFGRTGVAAGGYKQVTVDKYGRVTAGANPTTLAGFGILDAFTKTETGAAISAAVAALVASSPAALDTLNELAAALGNDPNFAASMTAALAQKAPLASPVLTGDPKAPTPAVGDNDTSIATTAFVQAALAAFGLGSAAVPLISDYNAIAATGFYRDPAGATNSPWSAATMSVIHIQFSSTGCVQLAISTTSNPANMRMFWRSQAASSWAAWKEVGALDSPVLTGDPKAPTPAVGDNDTSIATTAFVQAALAAFGLGAVNGPRVTDLDALAYGGMYFATSTAAGMPIAANASLIHVPYSDGSAALQICCALSAPTRIYYRTRSSGAWNSWKEFGTLDSPVLTGDPRAPTQPVGDNDTSIATTAFVQAALAAFGIGTFTGPQTADLNTAVQGGCYRTTNTTANSPVAGNMSVLVVPYNNGGCLQVASLLSGATASAKLYYRTQAGGAWSGWKDILSSDSPALLGTPTTTTPAPNDVSKQIVNTEFFKSELARLKSVVKFTANGNWTCPDGVTTVWISGCGGGGGGGGGGGLSATGAGGGGGGAAGRSVIREPIAVTPGTTYAITIGAGGAAGASAASGTAGKSGANGGTTSFGSLLNLSGGGAGSGGDIASGAGGFSSAAGGGGGSDGGDAQGQYLGGDGGSGGGGPFGTSGGGGRAGQGGGRTAIAATGNGVGGGGGGAGYAPSGSGTATGGAGGAGMPGVLTVEY